MRDYGRPCRFKSKGCHRNVNHPETETCDACFIYLWRWFKQGVSRSLKHQDKMRLFRARLEEVTGVSNLADAREEKGQKKRRAANG